MLLVTGSKGWLAATLPSEFRAAAECRAVHGQASCLPSRPMKAEWKLAVSSSPAVQEQAPQQLRQPQQAQEPEQLQQPHVPEQLEQRQVPGDPQHLKRPQQQPEQAQVKQAVRSCEQATGAPASVFSEYYRTHVLPRCGHDFFASLYARYAGQSPHALGPCLRLAELAGERAPTVSNMPDKRAEAATLPRRQQASRGGVAAMVLMERLAARAQAEMSGRKRPLDADTTLLREVQEDNSLLRLENEELRRLVAQVRLASAASDRGPEASYAERRAIHGLLKSGELLPVTRTLALRRLGA